MGTREVDENTRLGMNTRTMPHRGEMITAFLSRDGSYDGVFKLTGYSGGLWRKRRLLEIEQEV